MTKRVGVLDVGTNTVLYLLMAGDDRGATSVLDEDIAPTRLGEGLGAGRPVDAAVERTVAAIERLAGRARAAGADDVIVVGTEVLRRGEWRRHFLDALAVRVGLAVDVLSPQEEGELVLLAVRRSLTLGLGPIVAVDAGGGSLQIIRERRLGAAPEVASYPLGCVLLTERLLAGGGVQSWDMALTYVSGVLETVTPAPGDAVVAGGTAAAAVMLSRGLSEYDAAAIHGATVEAGALVELGERIHLLPPDERRALPGMPEGRADVFPAGALVLSAALTRLGKDAAVVSAQGLRFGVAYRYFSEEKGR